MKTHVITFRLTPEMAETMDAIRDRDGVAVAEQIRRGIRLWIESKTPKAPPATEPPRPRARRTKPETPDDAPRLSLDA